MPTSVPFQAPHRKRVRRNEIHGGVRFITFSCQRRLPLLHNPAICRLFVDALTRTRDKHGIAVYAWVVMPEHVHLLLRPGADLACPRFMYQCL